MKPPLRLSAPPPSPQGFDATAAFERLRLGVLAPLPCDTAVLYRVEAERPCLRVVAAHPSTLVGGSLELTREQADALLALCLEGQKARVVTARSQGAWLLPARCRSALLGPLTTGGGALGLALLCARTGTYTPEHRELFEQVSWLFAVVLEGEELSRNLERLRETSRADHRALSAPSDISASIVGSETGLREVMEQVELVARTDSPVLILGETGSGKEVVARAIHERSRRASGPILRVNCGAIPPELVDSELFGHERGSFTGASASRKGWFERADGGTLFLDEVGELPLGAQVRLLRVLQDGVLERVGGQRSLRVDVRVVAATHRDLRAMSRAGTFREDLWYRINVFPIRLPTLRERAEDIPALAAHFARKASLRLGASPMVPTPQDVRLLLDYDWPGNVRELAAVIERATILGHGKCLELRAALGAVDARPSRAEQASATTREEFPTLDQAMGDHIRAALVRTKGVIEGERGAAALLRINPHTLRARMRKLGIPWADYRNKGKC